MLPEGKQLVHVDGAGPVHQSAKHVFIVTNFGRGGQDEDFHYIVICKFTARGKKN